MDVDKPTSLGVVRVWPASDSRETVSQMAAVVGFPTSITIINGREIRRLDVTKDMGRMLLRDIWKQAVPVTQKTIEPENHGITGTGCTANCSEYEPPVLKATITKDGKPVESIGDLVRQDLEADIAKLDDAISDIYLNGDGKTAVKASAHPVLKIVGKAYRNEPAIDWEA